MAELRTDKLREMPTERVGRGLPGVSWLTLFNQTDFDAYQQAAQEMGVTMTTVHQRGADQEEAVMYAPKGPFGDFSQSVLPRGASFVRLNFPLEQGIAPKPGLMDSFWQRVEAIKQEMQAK